MVDKGSGFVQFAVPCISGVASITFNGTQSRNSVEVTFPAGLFAAPPTIVATSQFSIMYAYTGAGSTAPTLTTGSVGLGTLDYENAATATREVSWIAMAS